MPKLKDLLVNAERYFCEQKTAQRFFMGFIQEARALLCLHEDFLTKKLRRMAEKGLPILKTSSVIDYEGKKVFITEDGVIHIRIIYSGYYERDEEDEFEKKIPFIESRFKKIAAKKLDVPQERVEPSIIIDTG